MPPAYTYIPAPDYINSLKFDHVETYSFQRGKEYEENLQLLRIEYEKLKNQKLRGKLKPDSEQRYSELEKLAGSVQYLINEEGAFHPSSKKTHTFNHDDPAVERIIKILNTEVVEIPAWMCAPSYRDALVFYDRDGKIVSVLNICLSCEYMATKKFSHVNGDQKTYDLLKEFFIDIGHEVEES